MRKLKTLWRSAQSPSIWEELETWVGVLLFLGAALLLFVTLKSQAAQGGPSAPIAATQLELTIAPGMPSHVAPASVRREAA